MGLDGLSAGAKERIGEAAERPIAVSEREAFDVVGDVASFDPVGRRAPPLPALPASAKVPAVRWRGLVAAVPNLRLQLPLLRRWAAAALQLELDRGIAFILLPVFLAIGALIYFSAASEPAVLPVAASGTLLAILVLATRSRQFVNLALSAMLAIVAGFGLGQLETWRAGTKMLGGSIATQVTGRVVAVERMSAGRTRLTLDIVSTERPVLKYAPDRIRVSARKTADDIVPGATVSGLVRLMPPSGPVRPGSYDFSFESYFDGIGASGFFLRGPALVQDVPADWRGRFAAAVERLRLSIAQRIAARIGGAEGEIAAALVVGLRTGIPEDVNEALRRAGIYHVISISGLHMALVAGTLMGVLRAGFALFPGFGSRLAVKKLAAALALVGLSGYLFLSGGEVAAQRSFIMLAVMLAAILFDRSALTMRNLAISAVVVIVLSPHEIVGPSFQMSFAATAALVGAYAWWSDRRERRRVGAPPSRTLTGRIGRHAAVAMGGLAATSIVAGAATAVYAAYHFQQMPSFGLFTNLTAMPIVSVLVMPFAVLGLIAMPFGLDAPFFAVMGQGLAWTVAIARWFAERSPLDTTGAIPPAAVIAVTFALVIATACSTKLRIAAVPVAILGGLLLFVGGPRPPDVLVSEDARLVAVAAGDGRVLSNRSRPSEFTMDNWKRAFQADDVIAPKLPPREGSPAPKVEEQGPGFDCRDGLCVANAAGRVVVHAAAGSKPENACDGAALIVVEDASVRLRCPDARVISARDLARRGSAAVWLGDRPQVRLAIEGGTRPWHEQRRFSREARGMAPYRRPDNAPTPTVQD